jgi:hypothetical protein
MVEAETRGEDSNCGGAVAKSHRTPPFSLSLPRSFPPARFDFYLLFQLSSTTINLFQLSPLSLLFFLESLKPLFVCYNGWPFCKVFEVP